MRLYITIRTATKDLVLDYITIRLASGKVESINYIQLLAGCYLMKPYPNR